MKISPNIHKELAPILEDPRTLVISRPPIKHKEERFVYLYKANDSREHIRLHHELAFDLKSELGLELVSFVG